MNKYAVAHVDFDGNLTLVSFEDESKLSAAQNYLKNRFGSLELDIQTNNDYNSWVDSFKSFEELKCSQINTDADIEVICL